MAQEDRTRTLFASYKAELTALYQTQVREQEQTIRRIMDQQGVDEEEAREIDEGESGPLVHNGRAIHLIRKYWLAVDRLKKEAQSQPDGAWVEPLTFLVEYLGEEPDGEELVNYLTQISYWPIGLDENGEWT